jgi:pyruvate/2-oxoglutarate dehydrogenase complex dihydrolipoamide dehydrogenase (E3) component
MKVLVVGRGVAGTVYGWALSKAGIDVTHVVRKEGLPDADTKDEVRVLIDVQIETFGQSAPLTSAQVSEFRYRSERISTLCQDLNRIGARSVIEQGLDKVS